MPRNQTIKLYGQQAFTSTFMHGPQIKDLLKGGFGSFFIVKVEEMYKLVNKDVPASRSESHSMIYLTEGHANMHIGSTKYTIGQGEMLFVPAGQVFSFNRGDVNKGYLCNFYNDILAGKFGYASLPDSFDFLKVWGNNKVVLGQQTAAFVLHLLHRIYLSYTTSGLDNLAIIQPYFIALLCEVNAVYKPLVNSGKTAAVTLTNAFKQLIFTHIKTKHLVADYAALLFISPNHLNKSVKLVTGKSAARWINETIVLEAKVLLCQSALPISGVAAAIGFEDPSYFTRLFRKYEGVTPTRFRQMIELS